MYDDFRDRRPPGYREAIDRLMGCAVLVHGTETLADLHSLSFATLLDDSGLAAVADRVSLLDAASALRSELEMGADFARAFEDLDARRQTIALKRTYSPDPAKLQSLGSEFGVSRERARQLEVRLRATVEGAVWHRVRAAARWLRSAVGSATTTDRFQAVLDLLVGDAPEKWRMAAQVAVMAESGYEFLDGVVGDRSFREQFAAARMRAQECANGAGVIDEAALRDAVGATESPEWEALVRNAGLSRFNGRLLIRDTRRARVFLALEERGEPMTRREISVLAGLPDTSSLSSLLSSDSLFVRFTKDKWGLADWTDEPYEGVVEALIKRIEDAGGRANIEELVEEIPGRFDVLPATVRNYLSTRKFRVVGEEVEIVASPVAAPRPLEGARDVLWTEDAKPVLRLPVGAHHLRGNSQKIAPAVAQHLGVGPDDSIKVPFAAPAEVDDASVIWRSYDPNGPELGRLRQALEAFAAKVGDQVYIRLDPAGLRMFTDGSGLRESKGG